MVRFLYRIYEPVKSAVRFGYSPTYELKRALCTHPAVELCKFDENKRLVVVSTEKNIEELTPHWRARVEIDEETFANIFLGG
jgi:hypothetical protein